MVDKATTIPRVKAAKRIGELDQATLNRVSRALAAFLDLG
jgi:mRNA-degrading endonuclease toxin of MazEF toxin-antitoxin module